MDDSKDYKHPKKEWVVLKILGAAILGASLTAGGIFIYQQHETITDLSVRVVVLEHQVGKIQKSTEVLENRVDDTIKTTNRNFRTIRKTESDITDVLGTIITAIQKAEKNQTNPESNPSDFQNHQRNGI